MTVTQRLLWQNYCQLTNSILTVSSEETSYPKEWVYDPLRSKTWRSKTGWTIIAGFNDKLDITEGVTGDATATLTAGNYLTGALLAAEIETQLNAAATDNTWTCTYSGTTFKFTIGHDNTQTGGLEWSTGANTLTSCGVDIGFDVAADDTGAASYVADNEAYQSRHWLRFDLGASRDIDVAMIHYFNIDTSTGTVSIQANATDAWTAPSVDEAMTGSLVWNKWWSSAESYRYWRFLITDVQNSAGFNYVGITFIGEYAQINPGISDRFTEEWEELSEVGFADDGASFQHEKDRARKYRVTWPALTVNERNKLTTAADYLRIGKAFFFCLDPQNDPDDAVYVVLMRGIKVQHIPPSYWQIGMTMEESIG